MSLGLDLFMSIRKEKKAKDMEVTTPVAYPSGYLALDYMNGQLVTVYDGDDNPLESYISCGFVEGTMITVIADSGLGKTTFVQQVATDIVSRFDNSWLIYEDIEQAGQANRIHNISNMQSSWIKNHCKIFQDCHAYYGHVA